MKKIIAVISALSIAASLTIGTSAANLGDVNGDGKINSADALSVLKYSVGISEKGFIKANADVNRDGSINSVDALKILKVSVGLEMMDDTPISEKEIVDFYNTALNKTYSQAKKIKIVTDEVCTYTFNGEKTVFGSDPIETEAEFVNGLDEDDFPVSAYGPDTKLTEDMLNSVAFIKNSNSNEIRMVIKPEKVAVRKDSVYNAAGGFPFESSFDGTELKDYTSGSVTYTGTEIKAVIDNSGRVTELTVKTPYDSVLNMKQKNGKTDKTTEKGTSTYIAKFSF